MGEGWKFEIKTNVGLTHISAHLKECVDRHIGSAHLFVLQERFVEITEIGIQRIDRLYVELRCKRIALKCNRATLSDGEILYDDVLECEIIASSRESIGAKHSQVFIGRIVGHAEITVAIGAYAVAAYRVHHKSNQSRWSHIDSYIHLIYAWSAAVVTPFHAVFEVSHHQRRQCGGRYRIFACLIAVAESDECVVICLLLVA